MFVSILKLGYFMYVVLFEILHVYIQVLTVCGCRETNGMHVYYIDIGG